MNLTNEIVKRFMEAKGYKTFAELADYIGNSESNLNNKKRSGTIIYLLLEKALHEKMDLNALFYGSLPQQSECEPEIAPYCQQLKDIISSDHPIVKPAIIAALAAFQNSVLTEKRQGNTIKKQDADIRSLSNRVRYLEKVYNPGKSDTGTD